MQGSHKHTHTHGAWAVIGVLAAISFLFVASRNSITVANAGPSRARDVTLTDPLPANATFVALTGGGSFSACAPNSGSGACPAGELGDGEKDPNISDNSSYQTPAAPLATRAVGGVFRGVNSVKLECALSGATLACAPKSATGPTSPVPDGALPAGVTGAFNCDVKINASVQGGTIVASGVNITSPPAGDAPETPDPINQMMITDQSPAGAVLVSATAPGSSLLSTPVVGANGTVKATWNGLTLPGVAR
jgi:hypothetical protein